MAEITENELLNSLLAEVPAPLDETCEVCAIMLERQGGLARITWDKRLRKMFEEGKMTRRPARYKGRTVVAYRRAEE